MNLNNGWRHTDRQRPGRVKTNWHRQSGQTSQTSGVKKLILLHKSRCTSKISYFPTSVPSQLLFCATSPLYPTVDLYICLFVDSQICMVDLLHNYPLFPIFFGTIDKRRNHKKKTNDLSYPFQLRNTI